MLITIDNDPGYAPCYYLICKVTGEPGYRDWNTRDGESILIQSDWDFPCVASYFGFVPCKCGETDGTIDCEHKTAGEMINDARNFLDGLCNCADERRFIEDPGYFFV